MLFWMRWRRWFNGPILLSRPETCCDSGNVEGERGGYLTSSEVVLSTVIAACLPLTAGGILQASALTKIPGEDELHRKF